jgi:hypothetical protein
MFGVFFVLFGGFCIFSGEKPWGHICIFWGEKSGGNFVFFGGIFSFS